VKRQISPRRRAMAHMKDFFIIICDFSACNLVGL